MSASFWPANHPPIKVHSALVAARLPDNEFKVLGVIACVAGFRMRMEDLAEKCGIKERHARRIFRRLEKRKMARYDKCLGGIGRFHCEPMSRWLERPEAGEQACEQVGDPGSVEPPPRLYRTAPPALQDRPPGPVGPGSPMKKAVYPLKDIPLKHPLNNCDAGDAGKCVGEDALKAAAKKKQPEYTQGVLDLFADIEEHIPGARDSVIAVLVQKEPVIMQKAFDEYRDMVRRNVPMRSRGGCLVDLFKRFGGKIPCRRS